MNRARAAAMPTASHRPLRTFLRRAVPALLALALAMLARYAVVEPPSIAHACAPAPWDGACAARTLLIASFATQGIGWVALAAGAWASLTRRAFAAQCALAAGAAGLVLYSFEPAVLGVLAGMLVLLRVPAGMRQAPA